MYASCKDEKTHFQLKISKSIINPDINLLISNLLFKVKLIKRRYNVII